MTESRTPITDELKKYMVEFHREQAESKKRIQKHLEAMREQRKRLQKYIQTGRW